MSRAARVLGRSSGSTRSSARYGRAQSARRRPLEPQARQRLLVLLHVARALALARMPLEPLDRALALDAGRVVRAAGPSISRATRSRICSAKWGVAGPTSSRMSSTVTRCAGREAVGSLGAAHDASLCTRSSSRTRTISLSSSICACTVDADRGLVAHEPGVIVDAAHGVEPVAGLDVEQVVLERRGQRRRRSRAAAADRTCRSRRAPRRAAASSVRSSVREHEAVARVAHAPAEGRRRCSARTRSRSRPASCPRSA